jgi:hypothetical protein
MNMSRKVWDTKGLIKSRKSDNAMAKRTNNDLQNAIQKTKFRATRAPQKTGDELSCSERVREKKAPVVLQTRW